MPLARPAPYGQSQAQVPSPEDVAYLQYHRIPNFVGAMTQAIIASRPTDVPSFMLQFAHHHANPRSARFMNTLLSHLTKVTDAQRILSEDALAAALTELLPFCDVATARRTRYTPSYFFKLVDGHNVEPLAVSPSAGRARSQSITANFSDDVVAATVGDHLSAKQAIFAVVIFRMFRAVRVRGGEEPARGVSIPVPPRGTEDSSPSPRHGPVSHLSADVSGVEPTAERSPTHRHVADLPGVPLGAFLPALCLLIDEPLPHRLASMWFVLAALDAAEGPIGSIALPICAPKEDLAANAKDADKTSAALTNLTADLPQASATLDQFLRFFRLAMRALCSVRGLPFTAQRWESTATFLTRQFTAADTDGSQTLEFSEFVSAVASPDHPLYVLLETSSDPHASRSLSFYGHVK